MSPFIRKNTGHIRELSYCPRKSYCEDHLPSYPNKSTKIPELPLTTSWKWNSNLQTRIHISPGVHKICKQGNQFPHYYFIINTICLDNWIINKIFSAIKLITSGQGSENYSLWAKSGSPQMKFYGNTTMLSCLLVACGCFHTTMKEVSSYDRLVPTKPTIWLPNRSLLL